MSDLVVRSENEPAPLEEKSPIHWDERGPVPKSIEATYRLARVFQAAGICNASLKSVEHYMVVIWAGQQIGVPPVQAVQGIMLVNNRPQVWGDLGMLLVHRSGLLRDFKEWFDGAGDDLCAYCQMRREGLPEPKTVSYSFAEAKAAGLTGKDTYRKFPKRMLTWRARNFLIRDLFADVLGGMDVGDDQPWSVDSANQNSGSGSARSLLMSAPDPDAPPAAREAEAGSPRPAVAGAEAGIQAHEPVPAPPGTASTDAIPQNVILASKACLIRHKIKNPNKELVRLLAEEAMSLYRGDAARVEIELSDPLRKWDKSIKVAQDKMPDGCLLLV